METCSSPRLQQLKTAVGQGDATSLAQFWAEIVQTGAPFVARAGVGECLSPFCGAIMGAPKPTE